MHDRQRPSTHTPGQNWLSLHGIPDVQPHVWMAWQDPRSQNPSPHSASLLQTRSGTFVDHGRSGQVSMMAFSAGERQRPSCSSTISDMVGRWGGGRMPSCMGPGSALTCPASTPASTSPCPCMAPTRFPFDGGAWLDEHATSSRRPRSIAASANIPALWRIVCLMVSCTGDPCRRVRRAGSIAMACPGPPSKTACSTRADMAWPRIRTHRPADP